MRQILIVLFVMIGVSAVLTAVNPKDRPQIKRQLSTYVSTYPINNSAHRLNETKTYNYNADAADIINSATIYEEEEYFIDQTGWFIDWDYLNTYNYTSTHSHLNGLYNFDYSSDMPPNAFSQVRDSVYRIIDEDYSSRIHRHFDASSRLDTLVYHLTNAVYGNKYFKLHYAEGHAYADSLTCYILQNDIISDTIRYSLNYGNILTEHPVPLHMHEVAYLGTYTPYGSQQNYFNTPVLGDLLFISTVLNPVYQVASYTNLSTNQVQTITYEQVPTGYYITIGNKELYFDNDGYFTKWYETGWEAPYYTDRRLEVTWDTITANDDNVQPVSLFSIKSYPNPFKSGLTIKIANKEPGSPDISIYNIKGQLIRKWKSIKTSELQWDGTDMSNKPVSSGVYLIKAKQGKQVITIKTIKY